MAAIKNEIKGISYSDAGDISRKILPDLMDAGEFLATTAGLSPGEIGDMVHCCEKDSSGLTSGKFAQAKNEWIHPQVHVRHCGEVTNCNKCSTSANTFEGQLMQKIYNIDQDKGGNKSEYIAMTDKNDDTHKNANKAEKTMRSRPRIRRSITASSQPAKDQKYWDRRQKNNIAAKRSRDAKRLKEESMIERWRFQEEKNLKLRAEIAILEKETGPLL